MICSAPALSHFTIHCTIHFTKLLTFAYTADMFCYSVNNKFLSKFHNKLHCPLHSTLPVPFDEGWHIFVHFLGSNARYDNATSAVCSCSSPSTTGTIHVLLFTYCSTCSGWYKHYYHFILPSWLSNMYIVGNEVLIAHIQSRKFKKNMSCIVA